MKFFSKCLFIFEKGKLPVTFHLVSLGFMTVKLHSLNDDVASFFSITFSHFITTVNDDRTVQWREWNYRSLFEIAGGENEVEEKENEGLKSFELSQHPTIAV